MLLETPGMEKFSPSNLKLQNYKQLNPKSCNGKCQAILATDDTTSFVCCKGKERQQEKKKGRQNYK